MKKIFLLAVLSVISAFSVQAQINRPATAGSGAPEKPANAQNATGGEETPFRSETKPPMTETEELPDLTIERKTLGALSSGNKTIDGYIEEFCALYGVDPLLIYAQMSQESSFRARAVSAKGAGGFMQLMPATARRFGVANVYDPRQNIKAGVKYMRWLLDEFGGDTRLALAGYNAGEGAVRKYKNQIPPFRETRNYVAKIMNHYELLSNQDAALAENKE